MSTKPFFQRIFEIPFTRDGLKLLLIVLGLFTLVGALVLSGEFVSIDTWVFNYFDPVPRPYPQWIGYILSLFDLLGNPATIFLSVCGFWAFCILQNRVLAFSTLLILEAALTAVTENAFKIGFGLLHRMTSQKIPVILAYSFPSGHSMVVISYYGLILYHFIRYRPQRQRKILTWAAVGFVFLMGLSRIVLAVHTVSDVLGGWLLGLMLWVPGVIAYEYTRPAQLPETPSA